jgi:hypothetical protein
MFGDLPKLLDREFLFGFFLPAVLFDAATLLLAVHFKVAWVVAVLAFSTADPSLGAVIAVLAVWFSAGFLLALNSWIIRAKEGYCGWQMLLYPLTRLHRATFQRINQTLERPVRSGKARIRWEMKLASHFPAKESDVLPLSFGNTVRAFESYPLVMYDLDPIAGWSRLQMVMPEESRRLVDGAKSQVDFLLNLWAVWWALLLEYGLLAAWSGELSLGWFPLLALAGIALCSRLALLAALRWGDRVKAAFDVFLPALRRELGFAQASTLNQERETWDHLSRAFLYRDVESLRQARGSAQAGPRPVAAGGSRDR